MIEKYRYIIDKFRSRTRRRILIDFSMNYCNENQNNLSQINLIISQNLECNLDEASGALHPTTGKYSYFMTTDYPWIPIKFMASRSTICGFTPWWNYFVRRMCGIKRFNIAQITNVVLGHLLNEKDFCLQLHSPSVNVTPLSDISVIWLSSSSDTIDVDVFTIPWRLSSLLRNNSIRWVSQSSY